MVAFSAFRSLTRADRRTLPGEDEDEGRKVAQQAEQSRMLQDLWTAFDEDKSGKLDLQEVEQVLASALPDMSRKDLEKVRATAWPIVDPVNMAALPSRDIVLVVLSSALGFSLLGFLLPFAAFSRCRLRCFSLPAVR